jgi:hypothetical protein
MLIVGLITLEYVFFHTIFLIQIQFTLIHLRDYILHNKPKAAVVAGAFMLTGPREEENTNIYST